MTETVNEMPHAYVTQDLSAVELEFSFESGKSQNIHFAMNLFERFMSQAAQLVATARSQTLAIGDHLEVPSVRVAEAAAETPVGGGRVILSIRGDNGLPLHFSLSPEQAEQLRPQLFRAAKFAKKQSSQPRH